MNHDLTLTEALEDPEALPTVEESINTIFSGVKDLHDDLNIDSLGPMGLADPTVRKAVRNHIDTITNALYDLEQWGNAIIDHAEQTM